MLRFPYHTRYELIEFAVFTLAARSQGLASLHAACVGSAGRGLLLMGPTGSGKSTLTLQCMLQGFEIMSEDSVFVAPEKMHAIGVPNFLHVQSESLRWLERTQDAAAIRKSPIIRRRSGIPKFELDLRRTRYRLARAPLKISAFVFLSPQPAGRRPLLRALSKSELMRKMATHQAYAAHQPEWERFSKHASQVAGYELRRGQHPLEAVQPLRSLLEPHATRNHLTRRRRPE
jgi:energy-coupling factor transporter ATP-binding protein EcfA2